MNAPGIDYAWGRPGAAAIRDAGWTFVIRYLTRDLTGKALTLTEVSQLSAAGLWIVAVFEDTAGRMRGGAKSGISDAVFALAQARSCGMPDDRPIYFACDWDATETDQVAIDGYLNGAASVLGRERVGIYGGYGPVKRALDHGSAIWAWQTYAWSAGQWDPRARIQQYKNDVIFRNVSIDYDRAMIGVSPDYGQWMIGVSPVMSLTDDDVKKIVNAVFSTDNIIPAADDSTENAFWTLKFHVYDIGRNVRRLLGVPAPVIDPAPIVSGVRAGLPTAEQIAAAVVVALSPELLAEKVAGKLLERVDLDQMITKLGPAVAKNVLDGLSGRLAE